METAGQQVGKIETRLRQLGARLDRLVARADAAGTEIKVDYRNQIDHVRERHAAVHDKLRAFRAANGRKWDDFRGGVETAWHDFENALKALEHSSHPEPGWPSQLDATAGRATRGAAA